MANEITIRVSLQCKNGNLFYQSNPTGFSADMTGTKGASPGVLTIPVRGKVIEFGELSTPGWCWMQNLDSTNFVRWGIYDPKTKKSYLLGRLLAGECCLFRLDSDMQAEETGTGTLEVSQSVRLYMRADRADCAVRVDALEA